VSADNDSVASGEVVRLSFLQEGSAAMAARSKRSKGAPIFMWCVKIVFFIYLLA
jgi:hypothetical protein